MSALSDKIDAARAKKAQEDASRKQKAVTDAHTAAEKLLVNLGLVLDDFNNTIDEAFANNDADAITAAMAALPAQIDTVLAPQVARTAPAPTTTSTTPPRHAAQVPAVSATVDPSTDGTNVSDPASGVDEVKEKLDNPAASPEGKSSGGVKGWLQSHKPQRGQFL